MMKIHELRTIIERHLYAWCKRLRDLRKRMVVESRVSVCENQKRKRLLQKACKRETSHPPGNRSLIAGGILPLIRKAGHILSCHSRQAGIQGRMRGIEWRQERSFGRLGSSAQGLG